MAPASEVEEGFFRDFCWERSTVRRALRPSCGAGDRSITSQFATNSSIATYLRLAARRSAKASSGVMPQGGARPGAGRPAGSGTGRTVEVHGVSLPPEAWRMLDELRGSTSRGVWIRCRIWAVWQSNHQGGRGVGWASCERYLAISSSGMRTPVIVIGSVPFSGSQLLSLLIEESTDRSNFHCLAILI